MPFASPEEQARPIAATHPFSLAQPGLHEFYAATQADGPALSGLCLMLAHARDGAGGHGPLLWVRHVALDHEYGQPDTAGLAELGLDPARIMLVRAGAPLAALQAGLEGARTAGLAAVIIEFWGAARAYDLAAGRRLAMAAQGSNLPLFLARMAAIPTPSAAMTRWLARAAPSRALPANAPGAPAFSLALLRARNGREEGPRLVEWNRDAGQLEIQPASPWPQPLEIRAGTGGPPGRGAALSRPVAAFPADRQGQAQPARTQPARTHLSRTGWREAV